MNFKDADIDLLAQILHTAMYKSRRQAKRFMRDAGGKGSAEELDEVIVSVAKSPLRQKIEHQVENLRRAGDERQREAEKPGGDHPEWMICESAKWSRTFILHLCPGGSESFIAEIFDGDPPPVPGGGKWEGWPLDESQTLGNVLWFDGAEVPAAKRRKLYEEARRQLRIYDSDLEI